jgi:hypothetical protein
MSEPREDVLNKLDALLKKHAPSEPEIPVLTDLVEQPLVDLEAIPVLTDEIALDLSPVAAEVTPAQPSPTPASSVATQHEIMEPETPIELDLVHESFLHAPAPQPAPVPPAPEAESVLARLEAVEAEVQAEIEARIAQVQAASSKLPSIDIPQEARYVQLPSTPAPTPQPAAAPATLSAPTQIPEETVLRIATLIEADVARMIKNNLHQTLSEELPGMLNSALDKALSSMLEQFMVHMEDVVRSAIADELKKQLAPFKRPASGNKP